MTLQQCKSELNCNVTLLGDCDLLGTLHFPSPHHLTMRCNKHLNITSQERHGGVICSAGYPLCPLCRPMVDLGSNRCACGLVAVRHTLFKILYPPL